MQQEMMSSGSINVELFTFPTVPALLIPQHLRLKIPLPPNKKNPFLFLLHPSLLSILPTHWPQWQLPLAHQRCHRWAWSPSSSASIRMTSLNASPRSEIAEPSSGSLSMLYLWSNVHYSFIPFNALFVASQRPRSPANVPALSL